MTDDSKSADVISHERFRQRQINRQVNVPRPKPIPVLTKEWDEEANRYVETIHPGPLTRHFSQGDPGDER